MTDPLSFRSVDAPMPPSAWPSGDEAAADAAAGFGPAALNAMPLAEREILANGLAERLDASQLHALRSAFGDTLDRAVNERSGPAVREAYAGRVAAETREIEARVVNPDGGEVNQARWTVDEQGRPVRAEATLRTVFSELERGDAETQAQRDAADRGIDGDQGGHVFGHRFVTDQGLKNLFPQNGNFNMGAYKTLENEWAAWIDQGMEVRIAIDLSPRGADRPDRVRISYEVIDPADGGRVYDQRVSFDNRAGQTYDRIDSEQMDELIAARA
ncbi:DNA/RNA non-specific endonuclease [Lysobacter firmicutimachus]|uniref:DNA/RNA non-specific endonuclease n=1 Tax=Lysobacter firmicutimachus TaxID=1792846 RepID=A0AAU8MTU5_9GAMM